MPQVIRIHPQDNVLVALHPVAKGETVHADALAVTAAEDIPQGHKLAARAIARGENVVKYGFAIGSASTDIPAGAWVHTHNMHTNLSDKVEFGCTGAGAAHLEAMAPFAKRLTPAEAAALEARGRAAAALAAAPWQEKSL